MLRSQTAVELPDHRFAQPQQTARRRTPPARTDLGHAFYEELGPLTRDGAPDRAEVAACFERHGMTMLGPPLVA
ncbi:MAG TPA: hypothetical protein VKB70_01165 [Gaiellaceae bacterium]|nr:hypothetical protein [Gaiellaceae bacterium]